MSPFHIPIAVLILYRRKPILYLVFFLAASSQNSRPEKRSLTWESRDTSLTRDDGSDSSYRQELFQKLDKLESVMENQRKFLEDHDIKIQEIENVINKILKDKRRQEEDQIETTGEKDPRMKLVPRRALLPLREREVSLL